MKTASMPDQAMSTHNSQLQGIKQHTVSQQRGKG